MISEDTLLSCPFCQVFMPVEATHSTFCRVVVDVRSHSSNGCKCPKMDTASRKREEVEMHNSHDGASVQELDRSFFKGGNVQITLGANV